MSLFEPTPGLDLSGAPRPLAERMRPSTLDDYVGQEHILGPGKPLRVQIEKDRLTSLILWGPPGSGKTTLATLVLAPPSELPLSCTLSAVHERRKGR